MEAELDSPAPELLHPAMVAASAKEARVRASSCFIFIRILLFCWDANPCLLYTSYGKIEGVAYAFPLGSAQANYEAMRPVLQEMGAYLDFDVSRQARNPMEKLVKLRLSRHLKDGKRLRFDSPRVCLLYTSWPAT